MYFNNNKNMPTLFVNNSSLKLHDMSNINNRPKNKILKLSMV
jgi:hypothetical protein